MDNLEQSSVQDILQERGSRYGSFQHHAEISQALQQVFFTHASKYQVIPMPPFMVEALALIFHKLARIANGDPYYVDGWTDISGYSQLVANILRETDGATDAKVQYVTRKNGEWS